jgi:hypothetical protein
VLTASQRMVYKYAVIRDAFEGHLTLDVKSVIHEMNADLAVISGGMNW